MEALGAIEHKKHPLTTPKAKPVVAANCSRTCSHHQLNAKKLHKKTKLGDGTCHPRFNHCGCDFDWGDCCKLKLKPDNTECRGNTEGCCCRDPTHKNFGVRCPTTLPPIRPQYHPNEMNISIHLGTEDFNVSLIEDELEDDYDSGGACVDVVARGVSRLFRLCLVSCAPCCVVDFVCCCFGCILCM